MSEENNQSQENNVNKPDEEKDWKKRILIPVAIILFLILLFLSIVGINNHRKEKEAQRIKTVAQKLAAALEEGDTESAEKYQAEIEKILEDENYRMRIEDYEMKYKGKFFDPEFLERFKSREDSPEIEITENIPKIEYKSTKVFDIRPVKVSSSLKGYTMIISVKAENYDKDEIKYEFNGDKMRVFGATQVEHDGETKDLSFSDEVYFPAPPLKDKVQITELADGLKIIVPLKEEEYEDDEE